MLLLTRYTTRRVSETCKLALEADNIALQRVQVLLACVALLHACKNEC